MTKEIRKLCPLGINFRKSVKSAKSNFANLGVGHLTNKSDSTFKGLKRLENIRHKKTNDDWLKWNGSLRGGDNPDCSTIWITYSFFDRKLHCFISFTKTIKSSPWTDSFKMKKAKYRLFDLLWITKKLSYFEVVWIEFLWCIACKKEHVLRLLKSLIMYKRTKESVIKIINLNEFAID